MMKKLLVVWCVVMLLFGGLVMAQNGVKKKRVPPQDFGKVVINNSSEQVKMAPVVFDHWVHRSKYTCRLCHVDIGFEMKANDTNIKAADNASGRYCGTCHNGKSTYANERIFGSCTIDAKLVETTDNLRCRRCHLVGQSFNPQHDFAAFSEKLPKKKFGNGIDWIAAEAAGLIQLTDRLDGVSSQGKAFENPLDSTISPHAYGMPDIIFSHEKHGVWNGCELCHPDVFPSVKKGVSQAYSMNEIFEGKYCGACHGKVSFPMMDCERCHSKPVLK